MVKDIRSFKNLSLDDESVDEDAVNFVLDQHA
jgi:hypothetical protein